MRAATLQLNLSALAYHRILKLARKFADLAGNEEIESVHLAEALHASQPAKVDLELAIYLSSNYSSLRLRVVFVKLRSI